MLENYRIVALIPARGGSKGLPRKNVLTLRGKPLISWTIEHARESRSVDAVIVSTDDAEIAATAVQAGAEVPFTRPAEIATDGATTMDVVIHALDFLAKEERFFDIAVVLQPTSPLRTADDIDRAAQFYMARDAHAIVSVCEAEHHPFWMNALPPDGCMKDFIRPEALHRNRQALPTYYRLNGAVYLAGVAHLRRDRSFFGPSTYAYVMPRERSVDIDTMLDFRVAELLMTGEQG